MLSRLSLERWAPWSPSIATIFHSILLKRYSWSLGSTYDFLQLNFVQKCVFNLIANECFLKDQNCPEIDTLDT
jgi:hypothetical protein